jgi:aconitase A
MGCKNAEYERVLRFDLSSVVRNMAGPSNPHRRLPTSALAERGIADAAKLAAARAEEAQGLLPDGAVIIAAITSCTNTSNPRNVIASALLARNAAAWAWCASPGSRPRSPPAPRRWSCTCKKPGCWGPGSMGFGIVAFACTTCNGMSGALDPAIQQEIIDRDLYATAVLSGNRNFDGRIHPYAKQAFLASPTAGGGLRAGGHGAL